MEAFSRLTNASNNFKSLLLAKDAIHISTYPKYHSFLENLNSIDRSQVTHLFDSITNSKSFYKFSKIDNEVMPQFYLLERNPHKE